MRVKARNYRVSVGACRTLAQPGSPITALLHGADTAQRQLCTPSLVVTQRVRY